MSDTTDSIPRNPRQRDEKPPAIGVRRLSQVAAAQQGPALTLIAVTECVLDPMVITNLEGEIVAANQATVQLFGFDHTHLSSSKMSIFMAPESQELHMPQLERFIARMARCKEKNGFWPADFIHFREAYGIHRQGHTFPIEVQGRLFALSQLIRPPTASAPETQEGRTFSWSRTLEMKVRNDGHAELDEDREPVFIVFILKDTSERKLNEIRKETLLANISHELRTPINGIIGLADALAGSESNPGRKRHLELVKGSAKRLLEVFKDVTEMSKMLAQDSRLKTRAVDLYNALEEAVHAQKTACDKSGRPLLKPGTVHVPDFDDPHDPVHDMVDPELPDRFAFFRVSDTGCGIEEEHLARILHPFEQGEEDHALRQYEGLGLGLALVERIVKAHGGRFHIESTGSDIDVVHDHHRHDDGLPTSRRDADAAASIQAKRALEAAQRQDKVCLQLSARTVAKHTSQHAETRHILLVDEDPMTLAILENLPELAEDKWFFHQASTTNAADQWLQTHRLVPDLVMVDTDVRGDKAGCEYIKKLREGFSHKLLILCMSTRKSSEILRDAVEARANDFIYKPFDKFQLLSRLECMFALHQLSASAAEAQTRLDFMRKSLPSSICDRIEEGEDNVTQAYPMVSVMVICITATQTSQKESYDFTAAVNDLYNFIQQEAREYQLYTTPFVQNLTFLAAGGIDDPSSTPLQHRTPRKHEHVERMLRFGQSVLGEALVTHKDFFTLRMSMHCGPAHGMVIAAMNPRYVLSGETVNCAVAVAQVAQSGHLVITHDVREELLKLGYSDESGIFPLTPIAQPAAPGQSATGTDLHDYTGVNLFYVGRDSRSTKELAYPSAEEKEALHSARAISQSTQENSGGLPEKKKTSASYWKLVEAYDELEEEHDRALIELFELRAEVEEYRKRGYAIDFRSRQHANGQEQRLLQLNEDMDSLMERMRYFNATGRPLN
ncbi:hypothetical protein FOL47_005040 [Perkinsus chesapeaki]|uniref:histidine kinase n=1 Tax=Perkinsus chesapeaki TaxID=330153 RepID=A0A7J6LZ99_PERCH|nr:hypothetical protein FOL47_005040 [Perkinsus chesapeaki]